MIEEFIEDLCGILGIPIPIISYDTSHFPAKTTLAQCRGNTIYVPKVDRPSFDYVFALAHELRHLWQIQTDEHYYFDNYKPNGSIGLDEYNDQVAEVDANAFATIMMVNMFQLKPLHKGLSDHTIALINKRIDEIAIKKGGN